MAKTYLLIFVVFRNTCELSVPTASQFTRTMTATPLRKYKTVKGHSNLIKATKDSVSREMEGRYQHVGNSWVLT